MRATPLTGSDHRQAAGARHLRRTVLCAAALAALASAGAQAAIVTWTGNAPVYLARWYNGSYYETHEFQHALDWQGYCNAHFGAQCDAYTYWGSGGNWDTNARPTAGDDVRVPLGATVRVYAYNSLFQGWIPGDAYAGSLDAQGTVRVENGSFLHTDSAYIANLYGLGTLINNGYVTVDNGGVVFQGTGTTVVNQTTAADFGGTAKGGHTLRFMGSALGSATAVVLYEQSRFVNAGTLGGGTVSGYGTYNANTQSTFINTGTLTGAFNASGVRFNNDGIVTLASGIFDARYNGAHSGSFSAGVGTELRFGAFGINGHAFAAGSSILSDGSVRFSGSRHTVAGSYRAADTVVEGDVTFSGNVSFLDRVTAQSGGYARFQTAGGVSIGELLLSGGSALFDTGAPSSANAVTLTSGGLRANPALTIAGRFTWDAGSVVGTVHANGSIEMGAGLRSLQGTLHNAGTANWNAGNFQLWTGAFDNLAGSTLDLRGDFSALSGGASARFDNAGRFVKSAGTGIATLPVAFSNSGQVDAQSGTLRLSGGGSHNGSFNAAAGARIELSGGQTIAGAVATSGRVNVTGGSFTVLAGGSYVNASGNSISGTDFSKHPAGQFTNAGDAVFSGTAGIQGSFDNQPGAYFGTSILVNAGTITNAAGAILASNGGGTNTGLLDNAGALYIYGNSGSFSNASGIRNAGTLHIEGLANTGTITNLAAAAMTALGNVSNAGRIDNAGHILSDGSFTNALAGTIANAGVWDNTGTLTNEGGYTNSGAIANSGTFFVPVGSSVTGAGLYRQSGGITRINGMLQAGGGIYIDAGVLKGTGTIVGNVQLGALGQWLPGNSPGTMTVVGNVVLDRGDDYTANGLEIEIADADTHDQLVVEGTLGLAAYSRVNLVFLAGFVPTDGDSFQWLRANAVVDQGVATTVTGLPAGWSTSAALDASGARIELSYDLAAQIATSGNIAIAAGDFAMNAAASWAGIQRLDNAGSFSNRANASLGVYGDFTNQAGATFSNRGYANAYMTVDNAGTLRNRVGGEFSSHAYFGNSGLVVNEGTFTNTGQLVNHSGGRFDNRGVLDNPGGVIFNRGEFIVRPGGSVLGNGSYLQDSWDPGVSTRVDGRLAARDITLQGGTLTGSGVLAGPVTLGPGVTVQPGNSAGVLTIEGSLTAADGNLFIIELAGPASFDRLAVSGDAVFNYNWVAFRLVGAYVPAIGDGYLWLTAGGALSGLATVNWRVEMADGAGGYYTWADANYSPDGMQIAFDGDRIAFNAAPVPEPEAWALLLAGLGVGAWRWRRKGPG